MDIVELIKHPEHMNRDSLYELRSLLALYPYFQTARLLLLQNLYLLHDPSFDSELRQASIYITDRKVIFKMIEAGHYQLLPQRKEKPSSEQSETVTENDRTISLIDNFLESIPKEASESKDPAVKRQPTPADAAVDYVAYLIESGYEDIQEEDKEDAPQLIGQNLIDSFLENDKGKIVLSENPTLKPDDEETTESSETIEEGGEDGYLTETLARIYIKQGRYLKALEIIRRLSLQYPKKNAYFADQIRFLEKLIINSNIK